MTYLTNTNLKGIGAVIGACISTSEFTKYRQELASQRITYKSSEMNIGGKNVKGWLFSNGEFWSVSTASGQPNYCYMLNNSMDNIDTSYQIPNYNLPQNPNAGGGGNTTMPVAPPTSIKAPTPVVKPIVRQPIPALPSRTEVANCKVGWDANSNINSGQFNNFGISCDSPLTKEPQRDYARPLPTTVSGLGEDLNNCFEQWEFDVFGAIKQAGNFVDSDGKYYSSAMRTDWGGTPLFYVAKTINNVLYFCPATIQAQNGGNGMTPGSGTNNPSVVPNVTPNATNNPIDTNPTDDEPCPVDCEEIEEEITLYLSEVASDVYEEITIQETKEVCDTPPDTKEIETDCDDVIKALQQKYPNIEIGSLMGLAGLMGCGRKQTYTIQGLASAGGENTGTTTTNLYALLDKQIAELKTKIAQVCPEKDIQGMTDTELATAISQSIPIDILTNLPKVEEYLIANMNKIAQNICKSAKSKVNTAMSAEMINGIPNWALYLAGASLLGYGAYKYSQNQPKSKRSKK